MPRSLSLRLLQRLTILDVSDNEIADLPARFGELKWLRVVRMSRNHIVDMRSCVGLTGCEELDLSQNKITHIPDTISHMTSLVTLELSHNNIKDVPTGVCKVRRLNVRSFENLIIIIIIIIIISINNFRRRPEQEADL